MPESRRTIHIRESVHSIFYAPLLATVACGFLEVEGLSATISVVPKGQDGFQLLREGSIHVMQSAPSASLTRLEKGEGDVPMHIAAINDRDGFYVVGRKPVERFSWKTLEGASLIPSAFALQPTASLRFCLSEQGVSWERIKIVQGPTSMEEAEELFRKGTGDYVHLQNPNAERLVNEGAGYYVASVGASLGPIAFSSVIATRRFLSQQPEMALAFMRAYYKSQKWVLASTPEQIASALQSQFSGTTLNVLTNSVRRYKDLRNWLPSPVIPVRSYERAVDMWLNAKQITKRYPYEAVVDTSLAQKVMG
ncbi:MAG: ABC transporter substrate-binding protein [Chloroflexota bacterium]|nr:ABC transporter substrate-binding protein [Chloroflexota bacterium]